MYITTHIEFLRLADIYRQNVGYGLQSLPVYKVYKTTLAVY